LLSSSFEGRHKACPYYAGCPRPSEIGARPARFGKLVI
jgi:hypothetical protein